MALPRMFLPKASLIPFTKTPRWARLDLLNEHLRGRPMKEACARETVPGIGKIAQRFGLRLILQFGSTVRGMTHDRSDLDLAVQLNSFPVSLQTILEIQEALQVQFAGNEVDLVIVNRANPLLLQKIVESCRLLFGTPQDFARLRLHAFKAYQDFRPYLELEGRYVSRRLAALTAEPSQP